MNRLADPTDVLVEPPPAFESADAERLARQVFGLDASATPLESERDQNFRLRVDDGREVVLKVANSAEDPAVLDFETRALLHVAARDPELPVPRIIATPSGRLSGDATAPDGRRHLLRVLSFVPGAPLGAARLAPPLLRELGSVCARLGRALRGFFHPAAGRELRWDLKHAARLREQLAYASDPRARELAERALERFERRTLPSLPGLRAQVIHNDVSRNNTLTDAARRRVVGVIDFGDMVHAPLVDDVAVALAEALLGEADPVAVAREVVGGYASQEPLRKEERALLADLVSARLAMGIAISAWRGRRFPENREYIAGDDAPAAAALERLEQLERELHAVLAAADHGERPALRRTAANDEREETSRLLSRRRRLLGPALAHFYERPLHLVRGRGAWVFDAAGRAYLDAYNNVPHVGHCHPTVLEAIARQSAELNTNTRYLHEAILDYAERLGATLPAGLEVCTFVCSGSEANDLAWRLARAHTGQAGAIVVEGAYHGATDALHALSPGELPRGAAPAAHVRCLRAPDDYRGPFRRGEPGIGERYARDADAAIASLREAGLRPAACFVDPVLSSSGILIPPDGWLRGVFRRVRDAGGLCIADEVQAGFGRTGSHLWGFEAHGVVPDIVTLGKPIGNGYPLAAVVTRSEIAASLARGGEFFSTFGGNPVACAAGLAVLEVMERERLRENAQRVGGRLRAGLEQLAARQPRIGDVRGAGLFLGVELVDDRLTREPAPGLTHAVVNGLREAGVLVGSDGPFANVVKIRPPLVFSDADADRLLEALDAVLVAAGPERARPR